MIVSTLIEAGPVEIEIEADVPVASVEQVLGVEAWQAVEEQLYSAAEWSDEGPDPDAERDQEMDR